MALVAASGGAGRNSRVRFGASRRAAAALGLAAILAAGCSPTTPSGSPAPGRSDGSSRQPSALPSASPLVVGDLGGEPGSSAEPEPGHQVDFETNGDESNGWWWLRDASGQQQASWGLAGLSRAGQVTLDFRLLASNAENSGGGADGRFWLRYGPIVEAGAPDVSGATAVLITLPNTSPDDDPLGYAISGSYTLPADTTPGSRGTWVRLSRVGPDGTVLPGHLAVTAASLSVAGAGDPASVPPPPPGSATDVDFSVTGDEISGWWWLRDGAGEQRASWGFMGVPSGQDIRVDLELLATDTINGGRGIDARFWLTYRTIVEGGGGGPLSAPELKVLKNVSPSDDPVGYTTAGSFIIPASSLAPGAIGVWIGISRLGPDGHVLSGHLAVNETSARISGLDGGGPAATPGPTAAPPSPTPAAGHGYGPLTVTTGCQAMSVAPLTVTGTAGQNPHIEFAASESFSTVFTNSGFVITEPSNTYEGSYSVSAFPDGVWVRWTADHSVKAHAANQGWCPGLSSPTPLRTPAPSASASAAPSPSPTRTPGPPAGPPTIVALGNSYISGEAGRWAGNSYDWYGWTDAGGAATYDQGTADVPVIVGCHRSQSAEVHIDRGGYGHVTTINLACSGATTQTSADSGSGDKPGIDNCPSDIHRTNCPEGVEGQARRLTTIAGNHNVKLVVLSIGGNDFSFSDTVVQCSMDFLTSSYYYDSDHCYDDGSVMARFSPDSVLAVRQKLTNAYEDVVLAMRAAHYLDSDWSLLIQNYPSPLPPGDSIRYGQQGYVRFTEGCPFWNEDANWANSTALTTISTTINSAIAVFSANYPGVDVHVMDVSQALVGHRLCETGVDQVGVTMPVGSWTDSDASDGSEWVAQIRGVFSVGGKIPLPGSVYYKNESFHPNYWGQLALRNCLRSAWHNGDVRGGTCEFLQDGLGAFGEPQMILSQP